MDQMVTSPKLKVALHCHRGFGTLIRKNEDGSCSDEPGRSQSTSKVLGGPLLSLSGDLNCALIRRIRVAHPTIVSPAFIDLQGNLQPAEILSRLYVSD